MRLRSKLSSALILVAAVAELGSVCRALDYPIVDTGQDRCYDNSREIAYPAAGDRFFGQDAQYQGNQPRYQDHGHGTLTDLVTGLMWQKDPGSKKTFQEAVAGASACRLAGYGDWRLPSIKELYSLILFSGVDPDPQRASTVDLRPFIDTHYFGFKYGDAANNERVIDSQFATSTKYVSTTMHGNETMFGVNFADGRIKGYPTSRPAGSGRPVKTYYVLYVRGNPAYGKNQFCDNGDGTITDRATGLMWTKPDSGHLRAGENKDGKLNWQQSLRWAEDLDYAGHSDWRLPNVKELQSLVDYTRSPDTTGSAAIDPVFDCTPIRDALGRENYPFYWTSTTHARGHGGEAAAYVAFGRSQGWMPGIGGEYELLDVHGAGSQRSDPKAGDPARFPHGRGPQGDVICIVNMVRAVRGGSASLRQHGPAPSTAPPGRQVAEPPFDRPRDRERMPPGGPPDRDARGFVRRLDRDGDGRVSRQEFDGPAGAFDRHDADHDGYLVEEEAPRGPPPGDRRRPPFPRGSP